MTEEEIKALQDELEAIKGELNGLKAEKGNLAGELESRNTKITELEAVVAEKDNRLELANIRVNELVPAVDEKNEKISSLNDSLSQAVSSYKALVVKSNPGILEELITGDTIGVIDQSLENAEALIGKVRQGLEEEASKTKVPAGAPQRIPLDLSALSAREKIQYAIGGKK